jgi:ABC-type uncharacterized transport system involved in gliding motility auxiliary subunit
VTGVAGIRWRRHRRALVTVAAVAIVLVGANAAAHAHDAEVDLSATHRFSLASDSTALARAVRSPLRVTAFLNAGGPQAADARFLLARYHELNRRITSAVVDPDTDPGEAARFGVTQYSTVVLQYEGRRVDAPDATELSISTAILRLLRHISPTVCLLTGHGEPTLDDTSPAGVSSIGQLLAANDYQTKVVNLAVGAGQVPAACSVLADIGPRDPFLPAEVQAVNRYTDGHGRLLMAVSSLTSADPNPMLLPWGVGFLGGLVLDPDRSLNQDPSDIVVQDLPTVSPVVDQVDELQFPAAGGLVIQPNLAQGLSVARLATSGPSSYDDTHPDTGFDFRPGDLAGPIVVAAAADRSELAAGSPAGLPPGAQHLARTRVVVTGSDTWLRNGFLGDLGNRRFVVNALAWLSDQDQLVAATSRPAADRPLPFTGERQTEVIGVTVAAVPFGIVAVGIFPAVLNRRRQRRRHRHG